MLLQALDELEQADRELADAASEGRAHAMTLRHLERGGGITDYLVHESLAQPRATINAALKRLEQARGIAQRLLYELARSEGMSIADIARACGVSRQLVSRSLNETIAGD
jgi:DNA-binding phage protein